MRRRFGLGLALATLAIAVVVTQWPFEYRLHRFGVQARWNRIDWSWFPRDEAGAILWNRDFALNLVMLTPLGLGYGLWRRAHELRVVAESLVLGAVTSATLEIAQLATRSRFTSFPDLWRNALGCVAGCILALVIHRALQASRDA